VESLKAHWLLCYRADGAQSNLHAISHSLSLLQTNSTPFKDMSVEIQNTGQNNRADVVILLIPSFFVISVPVPVILNVVSFYFVILSYQVFHIKRS